MSCLEEPLKLCSLLDLETNTVSSEGGNKTDANPININDIPTLLHQKIIRFFLLSFKRIRSQTSSIITPLFTSSQDCAGASLVNDMSLLLIADSSEERFKSTATLSHKPRGAFLATCSKPSCIRCLIFSSSSLTSSPLSLT